MSIEEPTRSVWEILLIGFVLGWLTGVCVGVLLYERTMGADTMTDPCTDSSHVTRDELVRTLRTAATIPGGFISSGEMLRLLADKLDAGTPATSPEPEMPTREDWSQMVVNLSESTSPIYKRQLAFARRMASGNLVAVPAVDACAAAGRHVCGPKLDNAEFHLDMAVQERDRLRGEIDNARDLMRRAIDVDPHVGITCGSCIAQIKTFLSRTEKP